MGLFKRRSAGAGMASNASIVAVGAADLAKADRALERFEAAFLTETGYLEAGAGIAAAAGIPDFEAALRSGDPVRPWRWLAAVCEHAAADPQLVARVLLFTEFWGSQIAPTLTRADMVEANIVRPSDELQARITVAGIHALQGLPGPQLVAAGKGGSVTVEMLRRMAALRITDLDQKDNNLFQHAPGAVDLAHQVLAT